MKITSYLTASTITLFLIFGGCGKEDPNKNNADIKLVFLDLKSVVNNSGGAQNGTPISDVKVDFYANEIDYFANKNITKTMYSDAKGEVNFRVEKVNKYFFFKASKNELNSTRTGIFTNNEDILKKYNGNRFNFPGRGTGHYFFRNLAELDQQYGGNVGYCTIRMALSETPTKLNIEVFKNGNKQGLKMIILTDENGNITNIGSTNSSGVASFDFLRPQQYYFYVDKGTLFGYKNASSNPTYSNIDYKIDTSLVYKTTPASTNGKLADNPDITNTIQVSY